MRLYVVPAGSPVMIVFSTPLNKRYASYPISHAMVFEEQECVTSGEAEYLFKRDGKEYYFPAKDVRVVSYNS